MYKENRINESMQYDGPLSLDQVLITRRCNDLPEMNWHKKSALFEQTIAFMWVNLWFPYRFSKLRFMLYSQYTTLLIKTIWSRVKAATSSQLYGKRIISFLWQFCWLFMQGIVSQLAGLIDTANPVNGEVHLGHGISNVKFVKKHFIFLVQKVWNIHLLSWFGRVL